MKIDIIIPIFNEEENLQILTDRISESLDPLNYEYTIIFVDDGSFDNSWNIIKNLSQERPTISGIKLSRNFGHQSAIDAGLKSSTSEAVIIMDGDLQDDPKYIPELISEWEKGNKVVLAKRIKRHDGILRSFIFNIYFNFQSMFSDINIPKYVGHFSLLDKRVVLEMNNFPEKKKYFNGLRAYIGFSTTYVNVEKNKRYKGKTKMPFGKLLKLGLDGIFGFTTKPLTFIGIVGILISLSSITVPILSLMNIGIEIDLGLEIVLLYFLSGIQLLALSLLGKYLGTVFIEIKNRPNFIIESTTKNK